MSKENKQQQNKNSKRTSAATLMSVQKILTGAKVFTPHTQILCYGDSLTAGFIDGQTFYPYASTLETSLQLPVDYAGMCGWTTLDMIQKSSRAVCGLSNLLLRPTKQPAQKQQHSPQYKLCIIMSGTNDLLAGHTPMEIMKNLRTLHEICHDAGVLTVAISIPQSVENYKTSAVLHKFQEQTNSLLHEYAVESVPSKCLYIDMESQLPWSLRSPFWSPDGLHMSKEGYEEMGRLLAPQIHHWVTMAGIDSLESS